MSTPVLASSARNDSKAQESMSSVEIRVLFDECMDGTGKVGKLFANGKAQIPVTVLVSTDGCTVDKIGLVTKKLATDIYQGTSGHDFPIGLHVESLSDSGSSRKNSSFPSNQLYPVSSVRYDYCETFLITAPPHEVDNMMYELMGYVSLGGYRPGYGADAEEVTLFSFMSAENSKESEITMDSYVLLQTKVKPKMRFYTTVASESNIHSCNLPTVDRQEETKPPFSFIWLGQVSIHCDYGYNSVYPFEIRKRSDAVRDRDDDHKEFTETPTEEAHGIIVKEAPKGSFSNPTKVMRFQYDRDGDFNFFSVYLFHSDQDTVFVRCRTTADNFYADTDACFQMTNQGALATLSFFSYKQDRTRDMDIPFPDLAYSKYAAVTVEDVYGDKVECHIYASSSSGYELTNSCPFRLEVHYY